MSDLMLLGLIGVMVLLLLLTLLGFAVYSGLLADVVVSAGAPPIRNITLAYKFRVGPYGESGPLFTESCSISPELNSIGIYYDNFHTVSPMKCRYAVGSILSEGEEPPSAELISLYQKFGFKIFSFPGPSHVVTAIFPYTTPLSIQLAIHRVLPALEAYIKERKLCAHPRLEIYQGDKIYFVCPLARQDDFYVPETKELEWKTRDTALESDDAQTGGDTTSDTSSVSLNLSLGSRGTSTTTSTISSSMFGRGWDDILDNSSETSCSENSFSESGVSGSSFEELDLEVNGNPAEVRFSQQPKTAEAKESKEPCTAEKGEE
ncbi:testis-expressed protein 264 [Ornithorhynchus anatinus]|uniref:Testis expressed 264, ER-phagy receptor n=1 Tax=Ornithorhynchus anatinus TaxID=9258 RepID=A0A6I8PAP6_ORNAN|nr:testis-expressed protein 264 [Ornithorhynchus anatinus]XP_007671302.1 testis-expressed protein 264 [Ornithorhynchus anatinus]XP_007671303.1 testis-expressed protein 264 [Ornithorhynchus anatinus]XP_007671304.1 testis-expressed protein 264 [Ornithorhynchus anatinus]